MKLRFTNGHLHNFLQVNYTDSKLNEFVLYISISSVPFFLSYLTFCYLIDQTFTNIYVSSFYNLRKLKNRYQSR